MSSALSDVDFSRLQAQLLELRDANYQLTDKCKWQDKELSSLRDQVSGLDRDLQRSNMAIFKSKKAKEYEQLMKENESMQNKLMSQEEEFRLQNETLLRELAQLVAANEKFDQENQKLKSNGATGDFVDETVVNLQDNLRRLQAQNAALQNSLSTSQCEVTSLKLAMVELEAQNGRLSSNASESRINGNGLDENTNNSETNADVVDGEGKHNDENTLDVSDIGEPTTTRSTFSRRSMQITDENFNKELCELRLHLETEKQENKLLQEQLQIIQAKSKQEVEILRDETEKLSEKLRKKQESLVQLQEDKERLMEELRQKLSEAQLNKENELTTLKGLNASLEQKLSVSRKEHDEDRDRWRRQTEELEARLVCLEHKAGTAQVTSDRELAELAAEHAELVQKLEHRIQELTSIIDDLKTQLSASQLAHNSVSEQLVAMQADKNLQIQALQEANRLAEKRKGLLDELAIKYQQESSEHHELVKTLTRQNTNRVEELLAHIDQLQTKCADQERDKESIKQLLAQISSLETAKSWLERRLKETEDNLKQAQEEHERLVGFTRQEHETNVASLVSDHEQQIECARKELLECQTEREDLKSTVSSLQQEIKDHVDEKKLHEKKGATVLRDLKRQVQTERKRADKLQEKLQELLSDNMKDRSSVDELFRLGDAADRQRSMDSSSVCSWTPSNISRDNALAQTPEEDSAYISLRQENDDLLRRLGGLQQQMWTLDEKVSHLESSNAAMAEDLLSKTAVIEHYVMETKPDRHVTSPVNEKLTLKRVVDFVKDKGDENLKDINRKMQRVLEETLTKNMHLQRDLEVLSVEVARLRESSVTSPSPSRTSPAT